MDILERTHAAIEAALNDGADLQSWRMTQPGWIHIDDDPAHRDIASRTYIGRHGHRPLYGLPVEIIPGPDHSFMLVCAGRVYDERGLVRYGVH